MLLNTCYNILCYLFICFYLFHFLLICLILYPLVCFCLPRIYERTSPMIEFLWRIFLKYDSVSGNPDSTTARSVGDIVLGVTNKFYVHLSLEEHSNPGHQCTINQWHRTGKFSNISLAFQEILGTSCPYNRMSVCVRTLSMKCGNDNNCACMFGIKL